MKEKIYLILLLIISLGYSSGLMSQMRTISGIVTATTDNAPIIGANVAVKGTTIGTITDINGQYNLSAETGQSLIFSYIGFNDIEVLIGDQSTVDVAMNEGVALDEIVVTALGISREKKALGYSVQEVKGEALSKHNESNVVNSLSGKIAGIQVQGTGNLGGSSRITIRGSSSIGGNNQPLFVVDGIPIDNSNYSSFRQAYGSRDDSFGNADYGNAAQDINPSDIESISVLKGANAAALYGSRAANGVILITTKKGGSKGQAKVDLNFGITLAKAFDFPEFQNEYGGGRSSEFTVGADGVLEQNVTTDESWGPKLEGQQVRQWDGVGGGGDIRPWVAHPNNYRDFFETGITSNANVSIRGSLDNVDYRLSYTRFAQEGILPNSKLDRDMIGLNIGSSWNKFKVDLSANYLTASARARHSTGGSSDNPVYNLVIWSQRQLDINRLREYRNVDGSQRTWRTNGFDRTNVRANNPFWLAFEDVADDNKDRLYGNVSLTYDFSDHLSIKGRIGQDWYEDHRRNRRAIGTRYTPYFITDDIAYRQINTDALLTYKNNFEDISFSASVGASKMTEKTQRFHRATQGGLNLPNIYTIENSIDRPISTASLPSRELQSVYGLASFGYQNTYYVDVTARNDWSSALNSDNRSFFYPSVTGSVILSELISSSKLSFGKIRIGWAQVGSDTNPFRTLQTFTQGLPVGGNSTFRLPSSLNNPELKPEITTSFEIGTDLRFFNDRVGVDITYYSAKTKDQIFSIATSSTTGNSGRIVNAGEVENKGIELALSLVPVRKENFEWNVTANWAKNSNKLLSLVEGLDNILVTTFYASGPARVFFEHRVGQPMFSVYATKIATDDQGRRIVRDSESSAPGTWLPADTPEFFGSIMPNWTAGITNNLTYKNLSLGFLLDIQDGGVYYARGYQTALFAGTLAETAENGIRENGIVLDGVHTDGSTNTINLDARNYNRLKRRTPGDHTTFDASFVKLREISIGYTFGEGTLANLPFERMSISVVGRNLAILHRNTPKGYDPESVGNASGNIQGREYGALPTARTFGINLSIGF